MDSNNISLPTTVFREPALRNDALCTAKTHWLAYHGGKVTNNFKIWWGGTTSCDSVLQLRPYVPMSSLLIVCSLPPYRLLNTYCESCCIILCFFIIAISLCTKFQSSSLSRNYINPNYQIWYIKRTMYMYKMQIDGQDGVNESYVKIDQNLKVF